EVERLEALLGTRQQARFERVNVQLAAEVTSSPVGASVVDFGHVNVKSRFLYPLCSPVRDRPLCLGGVLWPESEDYVQPDPLLALSFEDWSRAAINNVCFDIAAKFRAGEIFAGQVRSRLENRSRDILQRWRDG